MVARRPPPGWEIAWQGSQQDQTAISGSRRTRVILLGGSPLLVTLPSSNCQRLQANPEKSLKDQTAISGYLMVMVLDKQRTFRPPPHHLTRRGGSG